MIRTITSYPGYFADTEGNIYSDRPRNRYAQPPKNLRRLKTRKNNRGYCDVAIRTTSKNYTRRCLIHQLVLEAFVGPKPEGTECRHLDGNPLNNHVDNLEWGTHNQNMQDIRRHHKRDNAHKYLSKLTEVHARQIAALCKFRVFTQREIAFLYQVSRSTVAAISCKQNWKYI